MTEIVGRLGRLLSLPTLPTLPSYYDDLKAHDLEILDLTSSIFLQILLVTGVFVVFNRPTKLN